MTREATNRLLEMVEEGLIDPKQLARDLLGYMSEDDVRDFAHRNDYELRAEIDDDDDEPDYDDDGMTDAEADADTLRMAGMGTDEDYGCFQDDEF